MDTSLAIRAKAKRHFHVLMVKSQARYRRYTPLGYAITLALTISMRWMLWIELADGARTMPPFYPFRARLGEDNLNGK